MKKVFLFGAVMALFSFSTIAQNNTNPASPQRKAAPADVQNKVTMDSLIHEMQVLRKELHKADSINNLVLAGIYMNTGKPRYKMYQTENMYNLLKLDSRKGEVWQVQYRMGDTEAIVVSLNVFGIVSEKMGWDGRFELYPTKNMYTFIMLDTETGNTYQVQWSTKGSSHRFVEPLK